MNRDNDPTLPPDDDPPPLPDDTNPSGDEGAPETAPADDELADIEHFISEVRDAMEEDSELEDDLEQWKPETTNVLFL